MQKKPILCALFHILRASFPIFSYLCSRFMQLIERYIFRMMWFAMMALPLSGYAQDTVENAQDSIGQEGSAYDDGLRFSLLTCTPGTDAYAHFGHTAILAEDEISGKTAVFNYGCFDATQKNFVMNFVKGDTNYQLDAETRKFFLWRYSESGNGVTEQELNLTAEEKKRLMKLLLENIRPENQTYLYNWLYDNCTERARDVIERAVDGKVVYTRTERVVTVRQMLHEKLEKAPWLKFGIDMVLGDEIDKLAERRVQMFIPDYFQAEIDSAFIVNADGSRRPMVKATRQLLQPTVQEKASLLSPVVVFGLLLLITLVISYYDFKKKRQTVWFDVTLHTLQGLAGIIIAYLFFFSKHPGVDSNLLVWIFNPVALCYALWIAVCHFRQKRNRLAVFNTIVCIAFIVLLMGKQQVFNTAVYLIAAILFVRSVVQVETNHARA